jgi:hypothetical protein
MQSARRLLSGALPKQDCQSTWSLLVVAAEINSWQKRQAMPGHQPHNQIAGTLAEQFARACKERPSSERVLAE